MPSKDFDGLMGMIDHQSVYTNFKSTSLTNITEEYVDLESRLKTKKEVHARYLQILKSKTSKLADLLEAERQIGLIQEEIESSEARLRYLRNKVNYSNISVEIYESIQASDAPAALENPFTKKLIAGFKNGVEIIENLLLILVSLWPLVLAGGVVALIVYRRRRK